MNDRYHSVAAPVALLKHKGDTLLEYSPKRSSALLLAASLGESSRVAGNDRNGADRPKLSTDLDLPLFSGESAVFAFC